MPPVSHRKSGVQFSISNRCPVESFSLQSNRCYFDLYAPPQTIARAKIKRNYGQTTQPNTSSQPKPFPTL